MNNLYISFLVTVLCFVNPISVISQTKANEAKWIGFWSGKLDISSTKLEIIFEVWNDEKGKPVAAMDVPMQGAKDIQCKVITIERDSLVLSVPIIMGSFSGSFVNDSVIQGEWKQSGMTFPLKLSKTRIETELKRPQTPQKPYPYNEEEVVYENKDAGIKLAGTLTFPKNGENFPAVILITGSGAQDRDETLFEHKPFLVIADFLTRNGIAVLRADDRGVGGSEGKTSEATSKDFADDVMAGIEFLKTRKEINPLKIGLIGHSEGGLIAPMVATKSKDVAFVVLLAGPGIVGEQILYEQGKLINKAAGLSEEQAQQNQKMQEAIFNIVKTETDSAKRIDRLQRTLSNGMYFMLNDEQKATVDNQVKTVNNDWFKFFLQYDPYPALVRLQCPVLALNGEKDLQVPPKENLGAIEKALTESGNKNFKTIELPKLNHLFQTCETGAIDEYIRIEETISPVVLEILKDWVLDSGLKH
jgi:pimeloyl-ACP methyl ester carboxylesterase